MPNPLDYYHPNTRASTHRDPGNQLIRGIKHTWSEQINCNCTPLLRPAVYIARHSICTSIQHGMSIHRWHIISLIPNHNNCALIINKRPIEGDSNTARKPLENSINFNFKNCLRPWAIQVMWPIQSLAIDFFSTYEILIKNMSIKI